MLYKGELVPLNLILDEEVKLRYDWQAVKIEKDNGKRFHNIDIQSNTELATYLGSVLDRLDDKETFEITDPTIIKILDREYGDLISNWYGTETYGTIIYERVVDEDGNIYGKEILTGSLFPLDEEADKSIGYKEYTIQKSSNYYYGSDFILTVKQRFKHKNFARITTITGANRVASPNEVDEYKTQYDTGFRHGKKKESFLRRITEFSKTNTLLDEVEVFTLKPKKKEKKEREEQASITKSMENVEFLIQRLKKVNSEKAEEFNKKYEKALSEEDILSKSNISIGKLIKLEAELEFELMFTKGENTSLTDKLDELKREYLTHFVTDSEEKTKITLDELDKLMELFLKTKDDYSVLEQRRILKNFASVYALEVKENESEVTTERLEDSYFDDLKKSIMLFINALIENGFVKSNMIVELSKEGTTEEILELIRSLEFNKLSKEQIKELKLTT